MADLKDNAYQIKYKLTPKKASLKGGFISGIVMAKSQEKAVKEATEQIKQSVSKEEFEVEVKLQSVVKLRNDFFLMVDEGKK
jgi:hypothetical protein